MPKKRKSGGRSKGKQGTRGRVQCSKCGRMVPIDKAKRITVYTSPVDYRIERELRSQGTHVPRIKEIKNYCISCAIHMRKIKIRAKEDRKSK
ncbi:MAG: 30S ribosomal protein S26e [Candidatus Helarchaeota archaeon]